MTIPKIPEGEIGLKHQFAVYYGFTEEYFEWDSYMWGSPKENQVTLSLVFSKYQGQGNFSKVIKALLADGFTVAVPTPLDQMEQILKRWGFKMHIEGDYETWTKTLPTKVISS